MNREGRRKEVWLKYDKHCAYCGKILEYKDMQVDHKKPQRYYRDDSFENLMPSCRRCNHYKRARSLEQFRLLIKTLHERINKQYITKVAIDYGIVKVGAFSGKFHFERYENN